MELLIKILGLSRQTLRLEPEHLSTTLNYHKRLSRCAVEVDSEVGNFQIMKQVVNTSGTYVGIGNQIIKERRKSKRS